jgi:hypothetical protein
MCILPKRSGLVASIWQRQKVYRIFSRNPLQRLRSITTLTYIYIYIYTFTMMITMWSDLWIFTAKCTVYLDKGFIIIAKSSGLTLHKTSILQFIHSVVWLTTGPKPLPQPVLHIVRSRASSFKWDYPLLPLSSSSSFLRLLQRLRVTSIPHFIFPSITCVERSFYAKCDQSS